MELNQYQEIATVCSNQPEIYKDIQYPVVGMAGETAEVAAAVADLGKKCAQTGLDLLADLVGMQIETGHVAEAVKKCKRDMKGLIDDDKRQQVQSELGDVLWYVAMLARVFGLTLEEVADCNLKKLRERYPADCDVEKLLERYPVKG